MRLGLIMVVLAMARIAAADVVIDKVGVHVAAAKRSGDKWDRGLDTKPDPKIDIYVDDKRIQECQPKADTVDADCAVGVHAFAEGSVVELRVEDEDILRPDPIGSAHGELLDRNGRYPLSVDGDLESAWIEVHHTDGPGIWQSLGVKLGFRGVGAVIGVAIALLLYKLLGQKLLTPRRSDPTVLTRADGKDDKTVRFWRSPILLASAACSIVCALLGLALRDPHLPLAVGCIPYVLGAFAVTAPIIDAHAHEHLGNKRLRLIIAAVAAMFAVPVFDFFGDMATGMAFLARHVGWTLAAIILLCLL